MNNVNAVLDSPPSELPKVLPRLFAKLLEPNQDAVFLQNYTGAIKSRFRSEYTPGDGVPGLSTLGKACLASGIVRTMLTITKQKVKCPSREHHIAGHHALDSLVQFLQTGTLPERRSILEEMVRYDAVNICLEKLDNGLCFHRHLAVSALRAMAGESFLGENISPSTAADIIYAMCQFTLEGPASFVQEMASPATGWQSQMIMGSQGMKPERSGPYGCRYYAMAQESALWAAHGLLCRSPPPNRQFCLDILKKKPEVLDLLFDCAVMDRPAWYPEMETDTIACEVLALLFHYPLHIVPGVSMSPAIDAAFKVQEWKTMGQSLAILTSRKDWAAKIIDVWEKVKEEDWGKIKNMFDRVQKEYYTQNPLDEKAFQQIFSYRGISRIVILRLIATVTHAADRCGVTNVELESFLHIAYEGSFKIKGSADHLNEKDAYTLIERSEEVFRSPLYTVTTKQAVDDVPEHIADESVMGPTALTRLLVNLAQRNVFDVIQGLTKPPKDLSFTTSLQHIQQITHPDVISRFLKIALQRVKDRCETGRRRTRENDLDYARVAFTSAAELAAALVAFDDLTRGKYSEEVHGARRELVLSLGNASEMAMRKTQYQRALNFALGALTAAGRIPAGDLPVDSSVVAKNQRRVKQAQEALGLPSLPASPPQ
ncbi:hypothetical protein SERLA73DRAFT_45690 [Serpula lacrymans var. lacrymans S7.3]|uniref:Uncharacterized protein n=2 Tax=Serpula lacrymans var. lacrymans TaxID=341189 RepID=F8PJQ6_SERL3|nr:hypothetical protein SERLA73DRAFT_45690 [Serpula lacrymans var. lacrymans S7.3]